MNLDPELAAYSAGARKGPQCSVGALLDRLEAEEPAQATLLQQLLDSPAVQYAALSRNLKANGVSITGYTLSRHSVRPGRPRQCLCP